MKLVINDDGDRIVRYGVADFQVRDDHVEVFYPHRIYSTTDAPAEETITGRLVAGVDSSADDDPEYRVDDVQYEQAEADDLKDYRFSSESSAEKQ